jgi:hypothetical protein
MVAQVLAPPIGGNARSSTANIMMVKSMVALSTKMKNYDTPEGEIWFLQRTSIINGINNCNSYWTRKYIE